MIFYSNSRLPLPCQVWPWDDVCGRFVEEPIVVSLIIPTYNEERAIARTLQQLRRVRGDFEVIVVDGESTDSTRSLVGGFAQGFPHPLRLIVVERNRAVQLNHAAGQARGSIFLFLHADVLLPEDAMETLQQALEDSSVVGGDYRLAFEGRSFWSRFFTWVHRIRRNFGIYYGDSGLFVRRAFFERLGGFAPIPMMDDYHFVRRMERSARSRGPAGGERQPRSWATWPYTQDRGRPGCVRTVCLPCVVRASDRRWRVQGVLRTLLSWFWIQALYSLGVPAQYLARCYKPVREAAQGRTPGAAPAIQKVNPA